MSKVRVNYKSDLPPIEITFKVNNVAVDVPDHDFVLRFFVDGCNESYYCGCRYVESEDGEGLVPEYSRCSPSSGGSKLTCYINNHKFTPGRLHVEMIDLAANESYADGVKKTVVPDDLDVYLIDGVGDEVDNVVTDTFNYCVGRGILSVTKQGTVGVVDTYTITFDDGTTTTYRVTNGRDGVVLDGDPATLIADDLVTSDSAKILSAKQGVVLRGSEVFLIPDDYAYNVSNFIPFLSIEAIGDIDALKSMSIYDTTAYTDAETDNTTLALFNLTINSSSTQIAIRKSDVSSSLGVQRIVKECIRWNLIFVFVVDFDLLEEYNGVARTNVNMKALKRNYNPFITKRQNIFGGYIEADAADTYTIGTRVCARLSDGENVFTYFKTRQDVVSNYNAARVALSINSYGDSVVELLKVDTNDWVMLRKVCQMKKGSVTCSQSNVAGAYTGGIKGNETLGLTSSTNAFTIAIKFKTPESWPLTSRWLFYNTVLSLALYYGRHSLLLQSNGTTLIESRTLELDTEYDAVITFDNGSVTLRINGVESSASDKSLTGTEGTPWVGSAQSSGVPDGVYVGIIRSLKIYDAVISNEDEIDAEYSTNANLLLNLQPQSVMDNVWLDMSDEMRYFTPRVQDSRIAVVYDNTGEASAMTHSLERVNLFNPKTYDFNDWKSLSFGSGVLTEAVLDTSSGAIGSWTVAARDQFSAVAVIPVSVGKYYCIINPYSTMTPSRVGVISLSRKVKWLKDDTIRWNYGNPNADNIYMAGTKYVVAQATFTGNNSDTVNAFVDAITVPLYRVQSTVPYPIETPMVEVYEMDSASEAIEYINCRIGEDKAIGESVNLDNKILDSDHVGTLSSMMSGTSMLVMGDSITANHGWTNYVANKLKWKGISNIAIGGANICASYNVTSGTQRNLIYQMRNIANFLGDVCYAEGELVDYTEGGSTVQRYTKTFDTVFISMGYNDASNGWTCGSLADVEDVAWSSLAPANDDTRFSSIAAAIKYCLFYLKTTVITGTITVNGSSVNIAADCRKARFIWQTPIGTAAKYGNDTTGATTDARLRAVEDVIAEVCNHYSVQVVNGRLLCGITREEENLYEGGKYLGDKTHPNADGYIKLGEMNLKAILGGFGYDSAVNDKQDTLVSGTNIKTVNNQTLLGSGNITIQGGGGGGVQSDWDVTDVTSMAYIKNKPTIPAAQVNADWDAASGAAQILNKPTIPDLATYCPIIEDTRSSSVAAITGTAPFSSLTDGQRIVLHFKYRNEASPTLQLTLIGGTTTAAIPLYQNYNSGVGALTVQAMPAGSYGEFVYDATNSRWMLLGKDVNTTYANTSQADINNSAQGSRLIEPKLLRDNFYLKSEVNNICPIIEDTRSSAVAAITGVAPFSTLVDGQRIVLQAKYNIPNNATLTLTLSNGNVTSDVPLVESRKNTIDRLWANEVRAGSYIEFIYSESAGYWTMLGQADSNTTYASLSQANVNSAVTSTGIVSGKLLHDNAYIVEETYSSGSLKANKMYNFGTVSSLTIPSLDATNDLVSNVLNFYALRFIAGADNLNITFPTGVLVDDEPTINTGDYVEIMINLYVVNGVNNFYASIKVWQAQ